MSQPPNRDLPVVTVPGWVIINATRYALGRATFIVSDTIKGLSQWWPHLHDLDREIILSDIETTLAHHPDMPHSVKWAEFAGKFRLCGGNRN